MGVGPVPGFADAAVRQAIAVLPRSGGADLVFEPGCYRFAPGRGATLLFDGIDDLRIEGNGAELMFAGQGIGMAFRGCAGLAVRGLVLDWPEPPFTQGTVTELRDGGHTLDMSLAPGFVLEAGQAPGALHEVDVPTGLLRLSSAEVYGGLKVVSAGKDRATLSSVSPLAVAAGSTVVLRHQVYGGNALHVSVCTGNVEFADMTVRAAPGMALYARNCSGSFRVVRLLVGPRPEAGRWLSTNADAIHIQDCAGRVSVEKCTLQGMGDDAINVHSDYLRVTEVLDRRTLAVTHAAGGTVQPGALPQPGAAVAFLSGRSLRRTGMSRLLSATAGAPARLLFETDLPGGLAAGDLLSDPEPGVELTVSDCSFPGNRGRGVVAHGRVSIERCRFRGQSRAAVFLAPDTFWLECCEVGNAAVRDNLVEDSCRSMPPGAPGAAAIVVTALVRGPDMPNTRPDIVNHDVEIRANRIDGPHGQAIHVTAVRDLVVSGNVISKAGGAAVWLGTVDRASVTNNTCDPPSAIGVQEASVRSVRVGGNQGLAVRAEP